MRLVWMIGLLFTTSVEAKTAEEAEYDRLVSEMTQLSKSQTWSAVNKRFLEMEKLGLEIAAAEWLLAAQAAQGVGDMYSAKERVTAALLLKEKKSTRKWYNQLNTEYGQVTLIAKSKGNRALTRVDMSMDPIQGQAVIYAQDLLSKKGAFKGLLPVGDYDFGGQKFSVKADMDIHLEISPKLRRKLTGE